MKTIIRTHIVVFLLATGLFLGRAVQGYGQQSAAFYPIGSAVASSDTIQSWSLFGMGNNSIGQLGEGTTDNPAVLFNDTPVHIADSVVTMSGGPVHTMFVKADGSLWGMGGNEYGQLGDGTDSSRSTPVHIADGVRAVSAGTYESLYIRDDNTLWGMGRNKYGQLGDGTDSSRSTPVHIADDVLKAWAGGVHSLFLKADSSLWAMGRSNYGQLGISGSINTPVHLADGVIDADAGAFHNLFIKADGSLWGLGRNEHGELGDESLGNHFEPVHIADEVISAGAGYVQSLFVKADNTLWAMGGDGDPMAEHHASFVNQPQPKQITDSVISVRISSLHALFLRQDQSLWGMGFAAHGRLGDGTESNRPEPIYIAGNVLAAEPGTSTSLFLANEIVTLTNPDNEGEGVDPVVSLSWDSRGYDPDYHVQVAGDSLFASPVIDLANHGENELAINEGLEAYTRYFWRIRGSKDSGFGAWSQTWNFTTGEATSVDEDASVPGRFALHQNYPNPFNPATVIRYDLPEAGEVRLEVFDLLGRRVATLVNETRPSGRYDVTFDASRLSSGVYIYRLQAGPSGMQGEGSGSQAAGFTETRQMLFVK